MEDCINKDCEYYDPNDDFNCYYIAFKFGCFTGEYKSEENRE